MVPKAPLAKVSKGENRNLLKANWHLFENAFYYCEQDWTLSLDPSYVFDLV